MWLKVAVIVLLAAAASQRHLFAWEHAGERSYDLYDHEAYFRNRQGLLVHYRELAPRPAPLKGLAIIVHG